MTDEKEPGGCSIVFFLIMIIAAGAGCGLALFYFVNLELRVQAIERHMTAKEQK